MKRILISLVFAFMLFANAQEARTVTVTGTGTVFVAPDSAVMNVGVSAEKQNVEAAMAEVDTHIAAITEVLREFGVSPEFMQTAYVNLWQNEVWDEAGSHFTFYASHNLNVFVSNIAELSPLISALVSAGANSIGGVDFMVSHTVEHKTVARERAMESAQAAAEHLAKLSGGTVGQVLHVQEIPAFMGGYVAEQYARADGYGIEPGQEAVRVQLEVVFELE